LPFNSAVFGVLYSVYVECIYNISCIVISSNAYQFSKINFSKRYDKQDQQGKAAFNERNPHTTQQQKPEARSTGEPQTKTGPGKRHSKTQSRSDT
jgi:hypothetical protein